MGDEIDSRRRKRKRKIGNISFFVRINEKNLRMNDKNEKTGREKHEQEISTPEVLYYGYFLFMLDFRGFSLLRIFMNSEDRPSEFLP